MRAGLFWTEETLPAGTDAVLVAAVFSGNSAVANATVAGRVNPPSSAGSTIVLLDDGLGADAAAGDGLYSVIVPVLEIGEYQALVEITGLDGQQNQFRRCAADAFRAVASGAAFTGAPFTVQGVDTNGNWRFDRLRISAPLTVSIAGDYIFTALLETALGETHSAYGYATLGVGAQTIPAYIEAPAILAVGENGPYTIREAELQYVGDGGAAPADRLVNGTQLTQAWQLSQFEPPWITLTGITSDYGIDTNGNGLFDSLRVDVQLNTLLSGECKYAVSLHDDCDGVIELLSGFQTFAARTPQTLELTFQGARIGARGFDGPYAVRDLLIAGSEQTVTVSLVAITQAYTCGQFEAYTPAPDCDANGVPDECDPDCDFDDVPDACEIAQGVADCNSNGVPDACDIAIGGFPDCTGNGVIDTCETGTSQGLAGAYYNSTTLTGTPYGRIDPAIGFAWYENPAWPGGNPDNFSIRWTGYLMTLSAGAGDYTFTVVTGGGVRLRINNQLIVDRWGEGALSGHSGTIALESNRVYAISLEYYTTTGDATVSLGWQPPGTTGAVPLPSSHLIPSRDCNSNGQNDLCDVFGTFSNGSPNYAPLGTGYPQTHIINAPPDAASDVTFLFSAVGDLNAANETVAVSLNGASIGTLFASGGLDCAQVIATLTLPAATYNTLKAGGDVSILMTASAAVNPAPVSCPNSTFIRVEASYSPTQPNDANKNLIPDECEPGAPCPGDMDCSGVVDFFDIDLLVSAFNYPGGVGWPYACLWINGDCDGDSDVDFFDIDPFIARLGANCVGGFAAARTPGGGSLRMVNGSAPRGAIGNPPASDPHALAALLEAAVSPANSEALHAAVSTLASNPPPGSTIKWELVWEEMSE